MATSMAPPPAMPPIRPGVKGEAGEVRWSCSSGRPLGGTGIAGEVDGDGDGVLVAGDAGDRVGGDDEIIVAVEVVVLVAGMTEVEVDVGVAVGVEVDVGVEVEVEISGGFETIDVAASVTVATLGGGCEATAAGSFPVLPNLSGIDWRLTS